MPVKVATTKNKHGKQGTGGGKTHDYDDDGKQLLLIVHIGNQFLLGFTS